jgi:hypothetical protein
MQDHDVLQQVHHAFWLITQELGTSFSRDKLFWLIERSRGKPLKFEQCDLPAGYLGYCFALRDADVVCVRAGLAPERSLLVELHEASHFLLRHVPRLSLGPATPSYDEYRKHADSFLRTEALYRSVYDRPQERAAELLGRALAKAVRKYEQAHTLPLPVAYLYGEERLV